MARAVRWRYRHGTRVRHCHQRGAVRGRFPAGVQDVLNRLVDVYAGWSPSTNGVPLEWCVLSRWSRKWKVRGAVAISRVPCRSSCRSEIVASPCRGRSLLSWPSQGAVVVPGLEIAFVNDASVPRQDAHGDRGTGSLFLDLRDGIRQLFSDGPALVMFANVNRGILIEERRALATAVTEDAPQEASAAIIQWLADPRSNQRRLSHSSAGDRSGNLDISILRAASSSRLTQLGAAHDIIVHAVLSRHAVAPSNQRPGGMVSP